MCQIIDFPVPSTAYPDLTADLDAAEGVLLGAIRTWTECSRCGEDPIPMLCRDLEDAGIAGAAFAITSLMATVARSATGQVDVLCLYSPYLSADEKHLLLAVSLVQAGERDSAARLLRTTLLGAQEAEFAIDPLNELGDLFARARLFLSRRRLASD